MAGVLDRGSASAVALCPQRKVAIGWLRKVGELIVEKPELARSHFGWSAA
jgi:hypothetical protein